LVGVFDVDSSRADALAARHGDKVRVEASVDGLLDRDDVDLVIIATTHRELHSLSVAALQAGHHVLTEKPGAVNVAEAQRVAAEAIERGRVARVGFNHRFHPSLLEARRLIRAEQHGAPLYIRARYGHGGRLGYEREWRANRAQSGGGELMDQGIHLIDLTRYLVSDVTLRFSELRTCFWSANVEDNAFLALECASGAFAWLHASWTEWKNLFSVEIMLERAKIEIVGLGGSYGTERLTLFEMLPEMGPPRRSDYTWPGEDRSWQRELQDVSAAIDGEESIGATIEDAIAALGVIAAAYDQSN
jgi:predicted dehydrogenase